MALVPSVRVTSRVQCCRGQRQSSPSPRCRSSLALSPRSWLTPPSIGLAGPCTSVTTKSRAWLTRHGPRPFGTCHFSRAVLQRAAPEHAFPALPLLVGLVAPLLADSPVNWSHRYLDLSGNQIGNQIKSVADVTWPSSLECVSLLACSAAEGSARARLPLPLLVGLVAPLLADSPVDWSHRHLYLSDNQIESVADVTWPSSLRYVSLLACSAAEGSARARLPRAAAPRWLCRPAAG
jgi:hypothetical protein